MKRVKRLLSCVLAILMVFATVPFAYAEESTTYEVGDIIEFGSYPQSKVVDETLIAELNALAPEWEEWISYGYYSGTGSYGTMKQGDWMRYVDIDYNGEKYRGVKFTHFRPSSTYETSIRLNSYQYDNGYATNKVYWFKFEPIDWRVLDPETGLVMCETIIDSQPYSNTVYKNSGASDYKYAYFNDASYENYANDYETSSIRQWLNNDFYNTAFTDDEKEKINITTLNNDGYYTSNGTTGYEKLDSNETKDNIFLISYNEARNSNFGFNSSTTADDTARFGKGSDYAKSQGLFVYISSSSAYNAESGNSSWRLRSPNTESYVCCGVNVSGNSNSGGGVDGTSGIRPALCFNDIETFDHQHSYNEVVTNPTCTEQGYSTYTCECGDTYVDNYVTENGHSHTSEITTEATHLTEGVKTFTCACGDSYTEAVAKTLEHTYTSEVTKEATHLAEGVTTYTCECGDTYEEAIAKTTEHTYTPEITTPATHLTEGVKTFTCACGDSYTEAIAKTLEHTHQASKITAPTCEEAGYTTYICACGDSYKDNFVAEKGHTYSGQLCTTCGEKCSCNCHKSGFMGFIWKIILFFNKLFKTNKTCACGVSHY